MTGGLLGPREGDTIRDEPGRSIQVKADLDELALSEFRYAPGEQGPPRHVHRRHSDAFYVLEGELTIELADEVLRAGPGTMAVAPAGLVHTFRNEGSGDARFLNIHAPSMGFPDHMKGRKPDFDQFDPPADGGRPASDGVFRPPGEGDSVAAGASGALFKAEGGDTGGAFSLTETTVAPGFSGPVPHRHRSTVDSFYVLEGTLTVQLDGRAVEAGPGSYALVAPGTVHTFSNASDRPVRMLNVMAPGGFEQYLKEVAAATPPGAPPDPEAMARIASKYDFEAA